MIEASNIGYQTRGKKLLENITFSALPGEFWAIVGANGAGKSTLLKLLSAELAPTCGRIQFNGQDLQQYKLRELARKRAVLAQQNSISLTFTVREIVLMGRYPFYENNPEPLDLWIVDECLRKVGIGHLAGRIYPTLSGGEQQRVQLARTLAQIWEVENGLLLLDEPTTGMDLLHQYETFQLAKEMSAKGFGVIAVIHDLNQALQYADFVLMLKGGQCHAIGRPDEVLTPQNIQDVFGLPVRLLQHEQAAFPIIVPQTGRVTAAIH